MKNKNIIICVLALIIVLLSGFIIYDKVLLDDKTDVVDKDNLDGDVIQDNNKDNKDEDKVDNNKENDIDNSQGDNVEKITGNYKNYTDSCGDKCIINYTFTTNDNYISTVDVDDTFFVAALPGFGKHFYMLYDGFLYYDAENCNNEGYCNFIGNGLLSGGKKNEEGYLSNLKKFTTLSNIKRIKSYSPGTDVSFGLFLITDDGSVYSNDHFDSEDIINDGFSVVLFKEFAKYEIDDILEYNYYGLGGAIYKAVLKDGTILTKTIEVKD